MVLALNSRLSVKSVTTTTKSFLEPHFAVNNKVTPRTALLAVKNSRTEGQQTSLEALPWKTNYGSFPVLTWLFALRVPVDQGLCTSLSAVGDHPKSVPEGQLLLRKA